MLAAVMSETAEFTDVRLVHIAGHQQALRRRRRGSSWVGRRATPGRRLSQTGALGTLLAVEMPEVEQGAMLTIFPRKGTLCTVLAVEMSEADQGAVLDRCMAGVRVRLG